MGPQHPSTHGVLRVKLKLDGERVIGSECVIGYLHRGVEKIAENRTYQQFAPYVDRMDYVAAVSNGLGYCEAIENLLIVEAPPRARVIRTILTELQRIASHLLWLGTHALDIGALTPLFYCFREREEILKILEKYCGARLTTHKQPHLDRAHKRRGDPDGRGCHRVWRDRAGAAGQRCEVGYPQGHALRGLRPVQV
jgi:NADH-quinone oxidoreductase subunit D